MVVVVVVVVDVVDVVDVVVVVVVVGTAPMEIVTVDPGASSVPAAGLCSATLPTKSSPASMSVGETTTENPASVSDSMASVSVFPITLGTAFNSGPCETKTVIEDPDGDFPCARLGTRHKADRDD